MAPLLGPGPQLGKARGARIVHRQAAVRTPRHAKRTYRLPPPYESTTSPHIPKFQLPKTYFAVRSQSHFRTLPLPSGRTLNRLAKLPSASKPRRFLLNWNLSTPTEEKP